MPTRVAAIARALTLRRIMKAAMMTQVLVLMPAGVESATVARPMMMMSRSQWELATVWSIVVALMRAEAVALVKFLLVLFALQTRRTLSRRGNSLRLRFRQPDIDR